MRILRVLAVSLLLVGAGACDSPSDPPDQVTPPPSPPAPPPPTPPIITDPGDITVNGAVRFQTISGWEAHASASHNNAMFPVFKDAVLDTAVDLGINRLRLEVRSGTEHGRDTYAEWRAGTIDDDTWRCLRWETQNDNADPNSINWNGFHFTQMDELVERVVLPLRQRLAARGERLYLQVTYTGFVLQCNNIPYHHDDSAAEYAELVLATFQHLQTKYGLVPDGWNMILEPDNSRWRGTSIGQAMVAAGNLLKQHGFTPEFIAPSATDISNSVAYVDDMMKVPGVTQYVKELSYHRYRNSFAGMVQYQQQLAARAQQYGLRTSMLEHLGADYNELHQDLTVGNVSAWQRFTLAGVKANANDDGENTYLLVDLASSTQPVVRYGRGAAYLFQYFRYIKPGSVRVQAVSTKSAFDPVAFILPNGQYVVVVKASAGGTFTVAGLPAGRYGVVRTTANVSLHEEPEVVLQAGKALTAGTTTAGVVTIYPK